MKRGFVYLFVSILFLGIFLAIIYAKSLPTERERTGSIVARLETLDAFIEDFHADVERAVFIAGFRSFIAAEEYISATGVFLTDASPVLIEAFMNGSINGVPYGILANSTFTDYLNRVEYEAAKVGIGLAVNVTNISLSQTSPWSVRYTFSAVINVTDARGLARWDYERNFSTEVSIIDTRDPLYSVYALGKAPNTIRTSPYQHDDLVQGLNDTTNLEDELEQSYYREDPHAPSYLQRLEGNLSGSSKYGISSLVNLNELDAQGIFVYTYRSVVDYVYFTNSSTTNHCPTEGNMPSWFKIDATHYNDASQNYEVDDLNATTC